jgi:hypothetical protein
MASPAAAWFLATLLFCACDMGAGDTTTHTYDINICHTYTVRILPLSFVTSNLVHAVYGWLAGWLVGEFGRQ